jgi:hypothetical protein
MNRIAKCVPSLAAFLVIGCASHDDNADNVAVRPSEAVSAPDADIVLAMVRDGDVIYVARPNALERMDAHTGERTTIAGEEWTTCPTAPTTNSWMSTALDPSYPNLLIQGTTAYLVQEDCGFWSFDIATKTRRMLVDPTNATKLAMAQQAGGLPPEGAIWNGKVGPNWRDAFGMSIARDGDGFLACFTAEAGAEDDFRERVALWSVALDGTPREQLAFIPRERESELGKEVCRAIVPDATSILFATDHALVRFDRATRALTAIATGMDQGTEGLAMDDANIYFVSNNAIARVPRGGGDVTTLVPTTRWADSFRRIAGIDGDYLYFNEGHTLKRMKKDGTDLIDFAPGGEDDWVEPRVVGITSDFVYFERITNRTADHPYLGTLFRSPK